MNFYSIKVVSKYWFVIIYKWFEVNIEQICKIIKGYLILCKKIKLNFIQSNTNNSS